MFEARVTSAQVSAGPERDVLLASKLRVPRPRPGWVSRPRLVEHLRAGLTRDLILVCCPAGFGKSSLLADWVGDEKRAVAWLSLDEGDNDPVRFWRHVTAALDGVLPGVGERAGALVGGGGSTAIRAAVTALVNDLVVAPGEALLVVDDYHLIQAPEVHGSLEFLLAQLPVSLRVVLASRSDPPLPLARLRARGQLAELRAADLRFTLGEAGELLRAALGHDLPDRAVAALAERTEGWVAGLQLAALSLQGRSDVGRFVEEFSGSHRYVLDYLAEEVLDRQPEQLRIFLLETSVLERLSGPLCDALTGHTDGQELLESAERSNLFLIPLDEERRWWRYHHLFADLLRARLLRQHPEQVPHLHRAAAEWHERHGLADDAVRHALAAGDDAWAARLIEGHLEDQILLLGQGATLIRWLSVLPPDVIHRRPRLTLGQAVVALLEGRLDEVEPLLELAERTSGQTVDTPYRASIDRKDSIVANVPAAVAVGRSDLACLRGDAERGAEYGRMAVAHLTDEDELLGVIARYHLGVADWLAGRLGQAEQAFVEVVAKRSTSGERHVVLRAGYDLGGVQQAQGRLSAALRTYQRQVETAATRGAPSSVGMAHVGMAKVLYERDELRLAREHATIGIEHCRRLSYAPPLVDGLLTLARIRHAEGDPLAAAAAIDEAQDVMPQAVELRDRIRAIGVRLGLADGHVAEAARWVRAHGLTTDGEPAYPREQEYLVLVRVLLAEHHLEHALEMLGRWYTPARAQGRLGSVITMRVLAALAHAANGDEPAASAALAEALTLAAPEGYIRVFVDEGAPLAALLRTLLLGRRLEQVAGADAVPREFLRRLASSFDRHGMSILPTARRGAVAVPGIIEPLSAREREVLALLATGHPNRAIADELVITVDTVKRHVSHVFEKLGVENRTQAVARARQLGLLP